MLSAAAFRELTAEDWRHNVQEDFKITLFHDLDHVLRRVAGEDQGNVLALKPEPTDEEVRSVNDPRFAFRGFDLVELETGIRALVNCGGFDKAFAGSDLSECGLHTDHAQALRVQKRLREDYPNEPHAACDVWAIWQLKAGPEIKGEQP
jgi:hypothetical protein